MDFTAEIKKMGVDFNHTLKSFFDIYLHDVHSENKKFKDAIEYSLLGDGKRLRPILLLKTYQIFGGKDMDLAESFAVAMECIHNYSLVHDDLPCMDNDDYRRGRLTNHKVYGEDIALLVGDALLNLAYEIMLEASLNAQSSSSLIAMQEIAFNAGVNGMIGGQVMEILTQNLADKNIDVDTVLKVKLLKTSCLFSSSIVAGAILADVDATCIEALEEYANLLGLAFQLKDDIMDKEFFVDKHKDNANLSEEELTYKVAKSFADSAKEKLDSIDGVDIEFYYQLADYMINRNK